MVYYLEPSQPPVPAQRTEVKTHLDDEIYEEVNALNVSPTSHNDFHPHPSRSRCSSLFDDTATVRTPSPTDTYVSVFEFQEYEKNTTRKEENSFEAGYKNILYSSATQAREDSQYTYAYCNVYSSRLNADGLYYCKVIID